MLIAGAGVLSLLGYTVGLRLVAGRGARTLEGYVVLHLALFLVYLLAVVLVVRRPAADRVLTGMILGFGLLFRLAVLPSPVMLSSDLYRYLWDGRVQWSSGNPYRHPPAAEALRPLRDPDIYPNINRPASPTVYPPGAEMAFALVTGLAPDSILGWRLFVLGCEAVTGILILGLLRRMGVPDSAIVVYAWAPLAVFEGAQAGHVDFVMLPFLLLALRARQAGRMTRAGAALGVAVLLKLYPAVLLLAWWRRGDRRSAAAFAAVVAVGYLAYLGGAGSGVTGFLPRYFGSAEDFNIGLRAFVEEGIGRSLGEHRVALGRLAIGAARSAGLVDPGAPLQALLSPDEEVALRRHLALPSEEIGRVLAVQAGHEAVRAVTMLVLFGLLAAVLVRIGRRRGEDPAAVFRAGMGAVAAYLVLVPTAMHAWYAVWVLPFLAVHPSAAWLWLTGAVSLSYLKYAWEPGGLPLWLRLVEFLPLYALLVWEWRVGRPRPPE